LPDKALVETRQRFEALVRAHGAELYRYAYWLARNRQQAEDTLQEALLRAWRAFADVRDECAVRSWLYTIVRNEHYRLAARDAAQPQTVDIAELEIADTRSGPFGLEMREAIMALPPTYAEPLALQLIGGFSCAEIALLLATSEGAVMTRLTRARQALRRLTMPEVAKVQRGGAS
jgi:RNA polymerase sigma-70 factor (ECF subfamily)